MNSLTDLNHADVSLPQAVRWVEPSTREIADALLDAAALPAGARVLDVGAGTGPLVVAAAERGYEVVGVDNAPLTATYLRGRVAPYPLATADLAEATALPYPAASFDAAFSVLAVMYAGPEALTEMRRVVRPGGTVAIVHWAKPTMSPLIKILWEEGPELAVDLPHLGPEGFAAALTGAGFTDVRVEPISAGYSLPAADEYLLEFQPFVATFPAFRTMTPARRAHLETALAERVRRIETGQEPMPTFDANVAWARVG
ncbi:class I SAM-dependent methyltransferase [Plantactinospora sp. WMMB334]|uniref:class I SAM-dependent methyltransferase n=1 Tax=Plantactinospora sp. WMMB334 TaxID=3404119 RepID=UPI003B93B3AD